jgi:hypothetical protein
VSRHGDAAGWGAVGALSFLVLGQGYRLVTSAGGPTLPVLLAVGAAVGLLSGVLSYLVAPRLKRRD